MYISYINASKSRNMVTTFYEFILQTISVLYPQYPNDVTKKKYYDTIQYFRYFFQISNRKRVC